MPKWQSLIALPLEDGLLEAVTALELRKQHAATKAFLSCQLDDGMVRVFAVLLVLLAGCTGKAAVPSDDQERMLSPATLEVWVTDQELVPIVNASVFLQGDSLNGTTNESGIVVLPMPAQRFTARAWAPMHYRNETHGDGGNESQQVHILLQRRPDDIGFASEGSVSGQCFFSFAGPTGLPSPCLPRPECALACTAPSHTVVVPVAQPDIFHNMSSRVTWEPKPGQDNLVFVVTLNGAARFASGASAIILTGPSPTHFEFGQQDLLAGTTVSAAALNVRAAGAGQQAPYLVVTEDFRVDYHVFHLLRAPPNEKW